MRATLLLTALLAGSANAITVLQAIAANPNLKLVQAGVATHPEWAAAPAKTLLAPTDAAIAAARTAGNLPADQLGVFFLPRAVDHVDRANYKILHGPDTSILFDNYTPLEPTNPEIHTRSSSVEGLVTSLVRCDDGFLYVSNIAYEPALAPSKVMAARQFDAFLALFAKINAVAALDSLKGVSIFVPTAAALTAAGPAIAALAPNQLAYVLSAHIATGTKYTTELTPGAWPSINNVPLTLAVTGEKSSINGNTFGALVDVPSSAGSMHTLDAVIIPANLPAADPAAPIMIGSVAAGGAAASSTVASATSAALPSATSGAVVPPGAEVTTVVVDPSTSRPASAAGATNKPADAPSSGNKVAGSVAGALVMGAAGVIAAAL
ncbi:hypothetical protein DFJ77DRAFT_289824 [Powellomyces hirtus]|nr:hypothetical protein DFJ77DRAFT_289824 [Powellomyces hirtus]